MVREVPNDSGSKGLCIIEDFLTPAGAPPDGQQLADGRFRFFMTEIIDGVAGQFLKSQAKSPKVTASVNFDAFERLLETAFAWQVVMG